jgi:hypothetical protein
MGNSVSINYARLGDNELDNFSESVYKALNGNTNFTWSDGYLDGFNAANTNYRSKLEAATNGNSVNVAEKNSARKEVVDYLRDIAITVNQQADGDEVKLRSSGLRLVKSRSKVGLLPKPTGLSIKSGSNSGEFLCTVDPNNKTRMYNFYTAAVPAPEKIEDWRVTPSSSHSKNITGFKPGVQYAIRCAYQGSEPELVYSDTVLIYAQ